MMVTINRDLERLHPRGTFREAEPMAKHTSWRTGGDADFFFVPGDVEDLQNFLIHHSERYRPLYFVGLGSNLLVRDGGYRGTIICTHPGLSALSQLGPTTIRCEVGVTGAKAARFSANLGLTGIEFLAGIPGTVGGALSMNAGAFGSETWGQVVAAETIDAQGRISTRSIDQFEVSYRSVIPAAKEWFVAAHFQLQADVDNKAKSRIRELMNRRNQSQPIQSANAGSVFRNPIPDFAARLIEASGFKGFQIGGAQVSNQHANFIVNVGDASANDIELLIEKIQYQVRKQQGVQLEAEVKIIGQPIVQVMAER